MDFLEIAQTRQSCRSYAQTPVEQEKLDAVLEALRLAPSACNGQPYFVTVCRGETAKAVAAACQGMGMNKFASQAPVVLVLSEKAYVKTAAVGSKLKHNDYRSIDIGIAAIGIIVSILNQVLSRSGREEQATMTTLAGLVVVLMIIAQKIAELFDLVKTLFDF